MIKAIDKIPEKAKTIIEDAIHWKALRTKDGEFVIEDIAGKASPVHLHAGEMHYFRVPEVHWEDRIMRLRAMGLNTVSTYVPWNWHETVEGTFDFTSDGKNVRKFLQLAHKHGML